MRYRRGRTEKIEKSGLVVSSHVIHATSDSYADRSPPLFLTKLLTNANTDLACTESVIPFQYINTSLMATLIGWRFVDILG